MPTTKSTNNFEAALKAEMKRAVQGFQRYTSEQRANRAASNRLGHRQRGSIGEAFWTHPAVPGVAFETRRAAALAAMKAA